MKTPIIIYDSGDVLIFESLEKATRYLEPIDIENGEYIGFDGDGYCLHLQIDGNSVIIEKSKLKKQSSLRKILIDFFTELGVSEEWSNKATLDDLVTKGLDFKTE